MRYKLKAHATDCSIAIIIIACKLRRVLVLLRRRCSVASILARPRAANMQHTKEFLGCDATFVTTKEIFHKDFGTPWASDVECAGGKAAPAFGYRVNPVTFEADQRFYGTQRDKAASTGSRDSEAAWYKAYHTENGDEFRDPQVRCGAVHSLPSL